MNVTIFSEFGDFFHNHGGIKVYPKGLNAAIGEFLGKEEDINVTLAVCGDEDNGLGGDILDKTDVLIWWGHAEHDKVKDSIANKVCERVWQGMGVIFLHSAHKSKPFIRLNGASGDLSWREDGKHERLWTVSPSHPIAKDVPQGFVIPQEEMYGEPFDIANPEEVVFLGWFKGGEVFRSGVTYKRGFGKMFYFQPGHETFPVYYQPEVQTIIKNAVYWAKPTVTKALGCPMVEAKEKD